MPGFDRKGPLGQGPMTGGKRGYCGSKNTPPVNNGLGVGRGGRPRGGGRGACFGGGRNKGMNWNFFNSNSEEDFFNQQIETLKQEKEELEKRLEKLENKKTA